MSDPSLRFKKINNERQDQETSHSIACVLSLGSLQKNDVPYIRCGLLSPDYNAEEMNFPWSENTGRFPLPLKSR